MGESVCRSANGLISLEVRKYFTVTELALKDCFLIVLDKKTPAFVLVVHAKTSYTASRGAVDCNCNIGLGKSCYHKRMPPVMLYKKK